METAKMSERGQIVIPKALREQLGVEVDTPFLMDVVGDAIVMKPLRKEDFVKWLETLPTTDSEISMEEIVDEVKAVRKARTTSHS